MNEDKITVELIENIRTYLLTKTKKLYFKDIKYNPDNIILTCPFHKNGQERHPSASIRITKNDRSYPGLFSCFNCKETMSLKEVIKKILGDQYDEDEVENKFHLNSIILKSSLDILEPKKPLFELPVNDYIPESTLKEYRYYHNYLKKRNITEDTANKYDIGYDKANDQITFPIRDKYRHCLAVGRRSITNKIYRYPYQFQKPLYGVYELAKYVRYLWICEGVFNVWSLSQYGKQSIGLLGTGTEYQYKQLLNIDCEGYVLCLDPDDAGRKGTKKLIEFLLKNKKYNINIALIPEGKDVNDLNENEFRQVQVVGYKWWLNHYFPEVEE